MEESNEQEERERESDPIKEDVAVFANTDQGPLDGGWGWMIVLGAAITNMMNGINYRMFGLVYLELVDKFQASSTASVLVGGLNILLGGFCGPLTAWLLQYVSHRTICVVGSTMAATGMISTGFVPNLALTYITYGILTGIGIGITLTSSVALVGLYFERRKGLALAIQHSTSGLSAMIFAPIMGYLMEEYNYSGIFLIFGGIFMHLFISCALYRPLRERNPNDRTKIDLLLSNTQCKTSEAIFTHEQNKSLYKKNFCLKSRILRDQTACNDKHNSETALTPEAFLKTRASLFANNSNKSDIIEEKKQMRQLPSGCTKTFSSLQNPLFLSYFLLLFSITAGRSVTVTFLPALAIEMRASYKEASLLPAIGGFSAVIASITVGALFDTTTVKKRRVFIYSMCCLIAGLSMGIMPLTQTFYFLLIPTVINGASNTIAFAQQMTVLTDLLGKENAVAAYGMTRLALAFGSLVGRTISAVFVDCLSTNRLGFYYISLLPILTSIIFTIACSYVKRTKNKARSTV